MTRRHFLVGSMVTGAIATTGLGLSLATRGATSTRPPAPTSPAAGVPSPTATPSRPRGGIARLHSPSSFNFDTFDALRAGDASVLEVLGRTHSRLVQWLDPAAATLGPDLARQWEQPEENRLVLHLDPAARWHQRWPMDGAPVTGADVVGHLERAIKPGGPSRTPALQRSQDYASIEDVRATEDGRVVTIRTSRPDPFLLQTLAGRFALIQSPRTVQAFESSWSRLDPMSVVGSGPFVLESTGGGVLRFTEHQQGHNAPFLHGIELSEPWDVATRFRDRQLDEAILRDRRDAPGLVEELGPSLEQLWRYEESPVISTLFVGAPPWDNPALQKALSAALSRGELARRLFGGRADPSGPVFPAHEGFALAEQALATYPGYRSREVDVAEARRLWEAGGGPGLGEITIDFPAIFDPPYGASAVVTAMLNEALGNQFRAAVDSYTAISQRAAVHSYGNGRAALWFGWGPPLSEPDPSRWLMETFSST
ncbi:MAG TPA: ABC transporter substrate-binding protein, partial [Tepidiformaceae bacterium]|nr:ABC transporter substrate-binding protein [Tepidiformaceae bacterium]